MKSQRPPRRNNLQTNVAQFLLTVSLATVLLWKSSVAVASEEKVKLEVYYEALCPSSEEFIINYLSKIFENGLIEIVDLELSPYGNAKISSNGTIVCQHGEWECLLNTVEACAIHVWPDATDHFPFIYCVEKLNQEGKYTEWETCFETLSLDSKPVANCYRSGLGHKLEVQYGDEIKALEPPHEYVPWVVVDGQPLYEDMTNFMSYICKAYKGSNTPEACLSLSRTIRDPKGTSKRFSHVCHKEDIDVKSKSTLLEIISSMITNWITTLA